MTRIKWTTESFIAKAKDLYGDRYDYSNSKFITSNDKIAIVCKVHSEPFEFNPVASDHLRGKGGCPKCKADTLRFKVIEKRGVTMESFLARAEKVHGKIYDYSKVVLNKASVPVEVVCTEHGSFFPTPQNHLNSGTGCPECAKEITRLKRVLPLEEFLKRSTERHSGIYNYDKVKYNKLHDFITVTCSKHGDFQQVAYDHLAGHGCRWCPSNFSKPHQQLLELLNSNGISCEKEVEVGGFKLDILCTDLNIAIEYNGLRWHSDEFIEDSKYHLTKTLVCAEAGIHIIHIWEDDWIFNNDKTKRWLLTQVGISDHKYNARDLTVRAIPWMEASEFVKEHHMQGTPSACEYSYGLRDSFGELCSVMLFSSKNTNKSEVCLERFCSKGVVRGGFSKLLKYFLKSHGRSFTKVVSFSDRSWSRGKVYANNGFNEVSHSLPRYWWIKGQRRYDRRGFQRKYLESRLTKFDPEKSEAENCYLDGYHKLYDCGITKWELLLT